MKTAQKLGILLATGLALTRALTMWGQTPASLPAAPMEGSPPSAASTGWSALGAMPAPVWDGKTLWFRSNQGSLAVTPRSDDVIRIRFTTAKSFGRDHSYAVVDSNPGALSVKVLAGSDSTELVTASLRMKVQQNPLRISIADANGNVLDADDAQRGISFAGDGGFMVAKQLHDDEHVYGFGEKNGVLDKRGWKLGGYNYVMWNSDTFAHDSSTDPIYVSVPFYLAVRNGRAHGIFLDDTYRSFFDIGRERQDLLTFGAEGGELNYYFINGPDPKKVVERYTDLTGRVPLPPRWVLGYNQCRYSYYPESRVRLLADTFREKQIPADVIWLDIHYQDNYKPFTWNHERFPDPKKMLSDLRAEGFHVVTIVDPHPKVEKGYAPYDEGIAGNYFVKNPDGSVYEAPVWPSQAEQNPGPSAFPDYSNPAARKWWGSLYGDFLNLGVAGIWNDMDEPAVFNVPGGTMPLDLVFDNEGQPTTHREIHNVYGQLLSRATFEGLSRLRPEERPFVLTRASFAGGQKYAAVWPGDNTSEWSSLRQSISTLLGLGLSGFSFAGCDIGGFDGSPSSELFTRWLQAGVFYPFMRAHSTWGSPEKEPWAFGYQNELINRQAIELRYVLLPYLYNAMQQASETGVPAMRPLFLEFPGDEAVAGTDDEFLFGDDLLVAPVLYQGATERDVYLPNGDWFDYWTGRRFGGGQTIHVPVTIESIPLFVRGGGFIFHQPVVQSTSGMAGQPLEVLVAPAGESEVSFYEDNGESLDYKKGDFLKRTFHQARNGQGIIIDVSAPTGTYRPAARELVLKIWTERKPTGVFLRSNINGDRVSLTGWTFENGMLTAKTNDSFQAMQFQVEY